MFFVVFRPSARLSAPSLTVNRLELSQLFHFLSMLMRLSFISSFSFFLLFFFFFFSLEQKLMEEEAERQEKLIAERIAKAKRDCERRLRILQKMDSEAKHAA